MPLQVSKADPAAASGITTGSWSGRGVSMKGLIRLFHSQAITLPRLSSPSSPDISRRATPASFPIYAASNDSLSTPSISAHFDPGPKPVVVVGSANADIYVEIERLPAAGETISARSGQTLAGGKGANQACCSGKLEHPTFFVGQIGEDAHGRLIEDALEKGGVFLKHLARVASAPTGHAVVMLQPDGQNSIIIVGGANVSFWPDRLPESELDVVRRAGVLLLQREIPDSVNIQVAEVHSSFNKEIQTSLWRRVIIYPDFGGWLRCNRRFTLKWF